MKKTIPLIALFLLASCKSFNDFTNQKVEPKLNGIQKMNIENNQYTSKFKINGKEGNFLVDTGAMSSVITDTLFLNSFKLTKENFYTSIKLKGAGGMEVESDNFITDSVSSSLFNSSKKIFKVVKVSNLQNKKCTSEIEIKKTVGIVGIDFFKTAKIPVLLDFENNTIKALSNNYSFEGFTKLNAKISTYKPEIKLTFSLDNEEIDFLFDTGNSGGFLLKEKQSKFDDAKILQNFSMIVGTANGFDVMMSKLYKNINIKLENNFEITSNVLVLGNLTSNTLGINFIKNFNWILDFTTGTIYVKKISAYSSQYDSNAFSKDYVFANFNSKLILGFKKMELQNSKFNVGDEIKAINNNKVTPENICEMQDLLNKTEDWSTLTIEVIPAKK